MSKKIWWPTDRLTVYLLRTGRFLRCFPTYRSRTLTLMLLMIAFATANLYFLNDFLGVTRSTASSHTGHFESQAHLRRTLHRQPPASLRRQLEDATNLTQQQEKQSDRNRPPEGDLDLHRQAAEHPVPNQQSAGPAEHPVQNQQSAGPAEHPVPNQQSAGPAEHPVPNQQSAGPAEHPVQNQQSAGPVRLSRQDDERLDLNQRRRQQPGLKQQQQNPSHATQQLEKYAELSRLMERLDLDSDELEEYLHTLKAHPEELIRLRKQMETRTDPKQQQQQQQERESSIKAKENITEERAEPKGPVHRHHHKHRPQPKHKQIQTAYKIQRLELPVSKTMKPLRGKQLAEAKLLAEKYRVQADLELRQSPWNLTNKWPTSTDLYPASTPELGAVLKAMATAPITSATGLGGGSEFKILLTLAGGQKAVFKPMRYRRDYVYRSGTFCSMRDTHNGEIAAFHLSRIVEFRKVPLAVGRMLQIKEELLPLDSDTLAVVNKSEKHICVAVKSLPKGRPRTFCVREWKIEGAVMLWMPSHVTFKQDEHPWGGVCQAQRARKFQYHVPGNHTERDICGVVQSTEPFLDNSGLFLDMVEASLFHFLINNADRKMYLGTGNFTNFFPVIDNGKSFGNPGIDIVEILAPLKHCCLIRETTYARLQALGNGTLSFVLQEVMDADPVRPVLSTSRLLALDRRLGKILEEIEHCIKKRGRDRVLQRDVQYRQSYRFSQKYAFAR